MKKVNINFTQTMLNDMNKYIGEDLDYHNRSDLVRDAVKDFLIKLKKNREEGDF